MIEFNTRDLLVSEEARWVQSRRPILMQVWRALRKINHDIAPDEMFLDYANFAIFASFVHRWTDTDYEQMSETEASG